jgi:hypothetical protein
MLFASHAFQQRHSAEEYQPLNAHTTKHQGHDDTQQHPHLPL